MTEDERQLWVTDNEMEAKTHLGQVMLFGGCPYRITGIEPIAQLRWAIQVTLDRYGHLFPELDGQIAAGLDVVWQTAFATRNETNTRQVPDGAEVAAD